MYQAGEDAEKSSSVSMHSGDSSTLYLGRASNEKANLHRGLNSRHTALIAIASGIGTGLFLGSGMALGNAGPLGLLIGYAIMGVVTAAVAFISAETASFLPISGGFIRHVPMFTDRALGVTVGYTFWYLLCMTATAEVVAASDLISFWRPDIHPAVFITVFMFITIVSNFLPVRFYGEIEFSFGMLKSLLVVVLILAGLIVDVGGGPNHDYIGGRNWRPEPIKEFLVEGSTGRFLAVWSTLTNAAFAMGNIQIATSMGSEVVNPRVNVPKAMRRVFWRIFIFYILSLLFVGLLVPSSEPRLSTEHGTNASPFVIAFETAGIKVLPSIINAVVITSAWSSGNGMLFLASRTLVGLASDGVAPQVFLKTNKLRSPYLAVAVSCIFFPLAYLNCGGDTPATVFAWFINLIAIAGLNIWCAICFAYLRFYYGMKARGIDRNDLPYKSWGQPYSAIFAGIMCFLIVLFSGFPVFFPGNWSASNFLSNYINCFVFIAIYIIAKLYFKESSPWVSYENMDFSEMDAIREEKAAALAHEANKISHKVPWWRKVLEKFFDE